MKEMVNSATGPVALDDLGIILPHEHLLFARDERLPFLKQELIRGHQFVFPTFLNVIAND